MYCTYLLIVLTMLETFRCTVDHSQASAHCYLSLIFYYVTGSFPYHMVG